MTDSSSPIFSPDPSSLPRLLRDLADPDLSLSDIADANNTTLDALSAWMSLPEIQSQITDLGSACATRTRLAAVNHLPRAVHTLSIILDTFKSSHAATTTSATTTHTDTTPHARELHRRHAETARRAATLLYHLARFRFIVPSLTHPAPSPPPSSSSSSSASAPPTPSRGTGMLPVSTPSTPSHDPSNLPTTSPAPIPPPRPPTPRSPVKLSQADLARAARLVPAPVISPAKRATLSPEALTLLTALEDPNTDADTLNALAASVNRPRANQLTLSSPSPFTNHNSPITPSLPSSPLPLLSSSRPRPASLLTAAAGAPRPP